MRNQNINAYAAGYIDGDGCIYLGKTIQKSKITVYEYSIQVVSVKRDVLQLFKDTYGGFIRKKPFKPNHRDAYCWTIKGRESAYVAQAIQSHIVEKREQCFMLVQFSALINCNKA